MALNQAQQAAARASVREPLKIIAGAGVGKTETLAARYVEIVRGGLPPERIVLLTFTEDAAAEMRARVMLRLRDSEVLLPPHALLHPWIATFHGFAMRLLREHGFEVGLPPTPRLLNDDEQQELWQTIRAAVEAAAELPGGYTPLDHTTYRWDTDEAWHKVMSVLTALRRGGGTPRELAPHPQLAAQQTTTFAAHRAQLVPLIEHCFGCYTTQLHSRGVLDYDELLQAALCLLQVQPTLLDRFDVVMVDEFQDTNRPQLELLQQLQPTLQQTTVVGDPRQAIYGWNSARAESIYEFPFRANDGKRGATQDLTENYRSHPAIVQLANWALRGSELGALPPLVPAQERQRDRSAALENEPVVSLHLLPTIADEAALIAAEIVKLHQRGLDYNQQAVLLRSRTQLPTLTETLRQAGVPYTINGGTGFYLHWAVRLTASLLRLVADPTAAAAWAHLLESPLIGLSPTIMTTHDGAASPSQPRSFTRWLDDPEAVPLTLPGRAEVVARLSAFRAFFDEARVRWNLHQPAEYLQWLWQASGMEALALADADARSQLVLRQLQRDADDYGATHPTEGIAGFGALLQQHVQTQPRVALPTMPTRAAVEIATVHQAKGREWPVVFVYHTALPSLRAGQVERVLWDEQWGLVISEDSTAKAGNGDPLQQLRADFRRRNRNEERSIWYVALTRAQERLYLLHSGCTLENGHFADARDKLQRVASGTPLTKHDEAVHFFHELWHHVQSAAGADGEIVCVPLGAEPDI